MNHLSHAIRGFNHFELKYLITLQQAEQVKSALGAYLIPDEHGAVFPGIGQPGGEPGAHAARRGFPTEINPIAKQEACLL